MITLLGLIGGLCFAYCGVPTAWRTFRAGQSVGTPVSIAWMIFAGGVLMYSYLTILHGFDPVITINYVVETVSWGIVVGFHYRRPQQ